MAKELNTNLMAKTTKKAPPAANAQPAPEARKRRAKNGDDPIQSKGIGLRESDWAKFAAMADAVGTNYHDLAVYVISDFMARWERGERPPTETKQVLKRP